MDKLDGYSMDVEQAERDKLQTVFPECFVEGKLNVDKLLALCGEYIAVDENDRERYEFRWNGKADALKLAQQRSLGTLRPCPEESVDWDTTKNLYIEGDNLEVLKLLQTAYYRKVKMIYIDPPYNTGNDFVYKDDFKDNIANYKKITSQGTTSNPETAGRYHTNWLNMMYPRLRLAKNLLRDDGVIFISIDDNELDNLKKGCDEIFGEECFVARIIWKKRSTPPNDKIIGAAHEYILIYAKNPNEIQLNLRERTEEQMARYKNPDQHPKGPWTAGDLGANVKGGRYVASLYYPIVNPNTGEEHYPPQNGNWRFSKDTIESLLKNDEIYFGEDGKGRPKLKRFLSEVKDGITYTTLWDFVPLNTQGSTEMTNLLGNISIFDNPKPVGLVKELCKLGSSSDDLILDFFSGSATTAHAVMQLNAEDGGNRRFILVQLPEPCSEKSEAYKAGYRNICEIGKERIRRAGARISEELEVRSEKLKNEQLTLESTTPSSLLPTNLDTGFRVFKLDSSNLKIWDNTPVNDAEDAMQRMMGMLEVLKPGRTELDVVYEVMLKLGQELDTEIVPLSIHGKTVYAITQEVLFIVCLAQHITAEDAEAMAEYAPGRIVFADGCFDSVTDASNVRLTLEGKGITIKVL